MEDGAAVEMGDAEAKAGEVQGDGMTARQECWREIYLEYHEAIRRFFR